ncbi:hypothetical protein EVAR_48759_1 [Eumeta japonica]|uniref:DUF5641 domain-containing protein n=1 Tax=Eumeta variegata TaxID=151549 RepID=A0A4C1YG80_EUMVA|nr:hypothetical protein EVAR_48759_1 [Eumeta japonica]
MSDLPADRVTSSGVFNTVQTDFAGPFFVKASKLRNAKLLKAYLCVFVCSASKAVHLEVVGDLVLKEFWRHLLDLRLGAAYPVQFDLIAELITWYFNPPGAPHFGGLFESAVKSAKSLLSRIIGEQRLTYEELSTVFARIEAVLNSRPLCPLSHDSNEFEVLTPAHLLIGKSLLAVPEYDWDETPMSRLSRFQVVQAISQHFWRKWNNLYLHQLQMRNKWFSDANPPKVGDLVLIKEDNLPLKWRRGRIEEMLPGKDGVVRVVILRTQSGKITRPVVKICRLPIDT